MGLLTTSAGSLPKPDALRHARARHAAGAIDDAALAEAEGAARAAAIALQEAAGVDVLVEGQLDRGDLVADFMLGLDGVEPGEIVRAWGNHYVRPPRVVGALARRDDGESSGVAAWRAAQALTGRPVKALVTGPCTLAAWSFDEHHDTRDALLDALCDIVRAEVAAFAAAGASEIQLDEPAFAARVEDAARDAAAIARVLEPAGSARRWVRLAYGDYDALGSALGDLPGDVLQLDLLAPSDALLEVLGAIGGERLLVAGVADGSRPDEGEDAIRARIERVASRVDRTCLGVAPDAGLGALSPAAAEAVLRRLVAAAG